MADSTEAMVRTYLAQTVGEVDFLSEAIGRGQFDLSDQESREFVGRLLVGQVRALYYLASQVDELKADAPR
jgi:hypothetical protein